MGIGLVLATHTALVDTEHRVEVGVAGRAHEVVAALAALAAAASPAAAATAANVPAELAGLGVS